MRNVSVFGAVKLIAGTDLLHFAFFIGEIIYIRKPDKSLLKLHEQDHVDKAWQMTNLLMYMHLVVAIIFSVGRYIDKVAPENVPKEEFISRNIAKRGNQGLCGSCN